MKDKLTFLQDYIETPLKTKNLLKDKSKLKAILVMILGDILRSVRVRLQEIMSQLSSIKLTEESQEKAREEV